MAGMYTDEKSTLMLISLMKAHGVRRVVASPGMRNMCLVASLQRDPDFEVYSSVDERSAAYIACGMAAETGEPVALSCTGATASRNYLPGLTEAYYRKLPVLAITSTKHVGEIGQLKAQTVDRRVSPNDVVRMSVQVPMVRCAEDRKSNNVLINTALLELRRHGGGPVHINLETACSRDFSTEELPGERVIMRHGLFSTSLPPLRPGRVGVFVGAHPRWSERLTQAVDRFCEVYDAVVFCDNTSNYQGKFRVNPTIVGCQRSYRSKLCEVSTLVHIGEVSGASYMRVLPSHVWRVSPDGEVRDTFGKLDNVFEMDELAFFEVYGGVEGAGEHATGYRDAWLAECARLRDKLPELPFSNARIAQMTTPRLLPGTKLHLGILNSLRTWNFCDLPAGVSCFSNTGGFGIDGLASTALGAALADPSSPCVVVLGDLAFFYDMNSLGNRHVPANLRILLVNNGLGMEFRNYGHPASCLGEEVDPYVAAAGHYSNKSREVVRHYAEDMGFEYLRASSEEEFLGVVDKLVAADIGERPLVVEAFTSVEDEYAALERLQNVARDAKGTALSVAKTVLGQRGVGTVKRMLGR